MDWSVVVLAIIGFTFLTLQNLLFAGADFNEGYNAYVAQFDPLTIAGYSARSAHPPLYYEVLHVWQGLVGSGVSELRFLSVIFAWIAIVFGFLLVRRWFGRKAAFLSVLLMALSPLLIHYGGVIEMYTMALSIALVGTYVLLRSVTSKDKRWWAVYAVLVTLGMLTNYFMALVWATHVIWLLYEYRKDRQLIRSWRQAYVWAFLLYLPWLPMMLARYSELRADGSWPEPLTLDALASTATQSIVFRSASDTTAWLTLGIIVFAVGLVIAARHTQANMKSDQKPVFRLVLALSSIPVILLALGSLPPLFPSYAPRYVLVATLASTMLIAIVIVYTKFKRHQTYRRFILGLLALSLFASGAAHAYMMGNPHLDTSRQNKLAQIVDRVNVSEHKASIILRSPYSYYVARFYEKEQNVQYLYSNSLTKLGSTMPLADTPQDSVSNFKNIDKVWMVGENLKSAVRPADGTWIRKDCLFEYDDITDQLVAVAAYYERVK